MERVKQIVQNRMMPAAACALLIAGFCGCGSDENGAGTEDGKKTLYVRGLVDLTGPTSDVSKSYYRGVYDFLRELNAQGGIENHIISYDIRDYAYDVAKAKAYYEEFKSQKEWAKVSVIFGWGTGDSMELSPVVTQDQKAYISASYAGSLASPEPVNKTVPLPDGSERKVDISGAPYNFFAGTDYSTSIRIALAFIKKRNGQKVGFAHCSAEYCTDPIAAGKTYAQEINLSLAPDFTPCEASNPDNKCPELSDDEATIEAKIKEYVDQTPDVEWLWIGNTTKTAVAIVKALAKYAPNVKAIVNVWGFDENVFKGFSCAEACTDGRMFGVMPFTAYGDTTASEMSYTVELHDKYRKLDNEDKSVAADTRYVQGHVTVLLWKKAVEQMLKEKKEITGPTLKATLETFTNFNTGKLTAPLSFSPTDHRPNNQARIYSLSSNGYLKFEDELSVPKQADWLGW